MNQTAPALATRNRNLDLLRAMAILMVVIDHMMVQAPLHLPWLKRITDFGIYGVDLFFVLSGWLIGGLYWREHRNFGNVAIVRFWIRRWLRTIPPYLVTLLIASLAAYGLRRQPFDFGYLLFIQNYYDHMPYFLISWSLCVEEHFYLLAPLLFLILRGFGGARVTIALFSVLALAATASRFLEASALSNSFPYTYTASHLRMDGLALGCFLSYLATEAPGSFKLLSRAAPYAMLGFVVLLMVLSNAGWTAWYTLWGTGIGLFFSCLLLLAISGKEVGAPIARIAGPIALASYSVYLTHAWALTVARTLAGHVPAAAAPILYFLVATVAVATLGAAFYVFVEQASIRFRDLRWPRKAVAGAVAPVMPAGVQATR
ncbi:MAG TPA: acyltransferase [Micropepsaceae bacterium]|nr:acyltransferase [Micropepsaceae bacterium]